jgi:hypothetical protein
LFLQFYHSRGLYFSAVLICGGVLAVRTKQAFVLSAGGANIPSFIDGWRSITQVRIYLNLGLGPSLSGKSTPWRQSADYPFTCDCYLGSISQHHFVTCRGRRGDCIFQVFPESNPMGNLQRYYLTATCMVRVREKAPAGCITTSYERSHMRGRKLRHGSVRL